MTGESFSYLKKHSYDSMLLHNFQGKLLLSTINPGVNGKSQPWDLCCHFADIYVDELERINDAKVFV